MILNYAECIGNFQSGFVFLVYLSILNYSPRQRRRAYKSERQILLIFLRRVGAGQMTSKKFPVKWPGKMAGKVKKNGGLRSKINALFNSIFDALSEYIFIVAAEPTKKKIEQKKLIIKCYSVWNRTFLFGGLEL